MKDQLGFKNTIKSALAALLGVQSNKNREVDFSQGKLSHFIAAGVIIVIVFIFGLMVAVSLVIPA